MTSPVDDVHTDAYEPLLESQIEEAEDCSHLRYVRGYFLTDRAPLDLGAHWRRARVAEFTLSWDGRTPSAAARNDTRHIVVIGRAFHLGLNTDSPRDIATHLLRAREVSEDAYNGALYDLAGRYVVVDSGPGGTFLQTDAAGMRSAYYGKSGGTVASHAGLAAKLVGDETPSPFGVPNWFKLTNAPAHPGRHTEYQQVYMLTPNTDLNVATAGVRRVAPAPIRRTLSAHQAAIELVPLMQAQLAALIEHGRPLMSLTAGLDSRTSLAVSYPMRNSISYFSYVTHRRDGQSPSVQDMEFARGLCEDLNLDFTQVTVTGPIASGPLKEVMRGNSLRSHVPSIAAAYREQLPLDSVHIRSNIYEIGRAFFRVNSTRDVVDLTPLEFAKRVIRNKGHESFDDGVAAFEDWMNVTGFGEVDGYDPYDLYYWELRMGRWLPAHMTESDIAHDTYTLVNCRRILELLLSVSLEDRIAGSVFDAIVALTWPELFDYPVNGEMRAKPTWA